MQVKSGNDDMRQDAVMQQFFELVNSVLQQNPDTQKRKLRIATYKVLTQRSAITWSFSCSTLACAAAATYQLHNQRHTSLSSIIPKPAWVLKAASLVSSVVDMSCVLPSHIGPVAPCREGALECVVPTL